MNANLREDDMGSAAGAALLRALKYISEISEKQEAAILAFQAKIPDIVNDEIESAILRLDNNEAPYGAVQKLNALAGKPPGSE